VSPAPAAGESAAGAVAARTLDLVGQVRLGVDPQGLL
jgi:hypothetical protein